MLPMIHGRWAACNLTAAKSSVANRSSSAQLPGGFPSSVMHASVERVLTARPGTSSHGCNKTVAARCSPRHRSRFQFWERNDTSTTGSAGHASAPADAARSASE
jgi:hypothetical protein